MTITETQKTAQLAAQAAVSAAEAKQYLLSIEQPVIDISESVADAQNAAAAAEMARVQAQDIADGLVQTIDSQLSEQEIQFESQMTTQQFSFISQLNQQEHEFDAQLASQESRYESVLQQAGKTVLGRYEDGPWTLTSYNQLVSYGGTFWKLAASVVIGAGYTTAGTTGATWDATDRANFVDVGQDQLRTELGTIFMPAASGNSATDVQLLQAALNVGGQISYNIPGEYLYGSHSVIKSGTSLITAAGVNWKQIAGKSNPFIVNEAFSASRYAVTSMTKNTTAINIYLDGSDIKSANYITVVCENHPFVRGDWAAFHGAKEFGYDGIMRVISVVDANTFIAESHSTMTADSATANTDFWNGMFCFKADTNIEVDIQGRIDGNWRGNSTASPTDFDERVKFMGMSFWGVNNLTVRLNDAFNIRKYAVLLANVRNVHVPRINFYNFSDGLHIQPPFVGISVGTLAGATGDDLLALTNGDYEAYQLSRGHGYSIYVDHLMPQNALTALKAAGAPGYKFWDIDLGSISGSVRLQIISAIRDGIL
ncbi:TPA: hypothetical protein OUD99_001445, partial [Klebsiella pneumoniae]|nr:hypothetical protein [Klebsiella pneumoniae]